MRVICALALLAVSGCAQVKFTLTKELPLSDTSAVQPGINSRHFSKIIVLRPSGTDSSGFENLVASFEREFLRHGVTVISGAVTGRVVLGIEQGDRKAEAAAQLTDIERALVMARGTGAEAILQIGRFDRFERVESRFLVYAEKTGIREVYRDEYVAWDGAKTALSSGASAFAGRLIDVATGEVVASFQLACASLWSLPVDIAGVATIRSGYPTSLTINSTNVPLQSTERYDWSSRTSVPETPEWERQGRKRCDQRMIERLIGLSLSTQRPTSEGGASPVLEL